MVEAAVEKAVVKVVVKVVIVHMVKAVVKVKEVVKVPGAVAVAVAVIVRVVPVVLVEVHPTLIMMIQLENRGQVTEKVLKDCRWYEEKEETHKLAHFRPPVKDCHRVATGENQMQLRVTML